MREEREDKYELKRKERKLRERAAFMMSQTIDVDTVDAIRRNTIKHREEMLAFQKRAGAARDAETAKFFKGEAQEAMKEYRGACLVMGHIAPGGDAQFVRVDNWPFEIIPHALRAGWAGIDA